MFEKAQSQIFQLMKYDSYTRFLKSNMYKECIMSEMEGKSIPYSKQHQQQHVLINSDDRPKASDSLVRFLIKRKPKIHYFPSLNKSILL